MPRISRRKLNVYIEERMFELLWDYISTLKTPFTVKEFLLNLFTETETTMFAKRLSVALLLSKGYTFDRIDETLKVSKGTITAIARQLTSGATGYQKAVSTIFAKSHNESRWDILEEALVKLSLPQKYGSLGHQIKSEVGKGVYKRKVQREQLM